MNRITAVCAAAVAVALAAPALSTGAPPGDNQLTTGAAPTLIGFGRATVVSGQLTGPRNAGETVNLEASPFPFSDFRQVLSATTDGNGFYRFEVKPALNTKYRVEAKTSPPTRSAETPVVLVKKAVTLRLSDYSPRRGQVVRFSGHVLPAHDGQIAYIQRRTSTGSYRTVAQVTLADDGELRSKYSRRLRVYRSGSFRVHVRADADHAWGTSARRVARVVR